MQEQGEATETCCTSPGTTERSRRHSTSRPGAGATFSGALGGAKAVSFAAGAAAGLRIRGGAGTTLDCAFRPVLGEVCNEAAQGQAGYWGVHGSDACHHHTVSTTPAGTKGRCS